MLTPTQTESEASGPNPYLSARRAWNDHVARLVAARTMWQVAALVSLMIALACVGALIHFAGRSRFVPYVVEVDSKGNVTPIERAKETAAANRAVIEAQLERFVTLSRRVTTDIALERAAIFGVYSMLSADDPAAGKVTDYLNGDPERTPFRRAEHETVSTEVTSVLPQSKATWQIDWIETVYDRDSGARKDRFEMRALLQVYQSAGKSSNEEELRGNPLGIYIRDFNWTRRKTTQVPQ
jgi:type IV secretion system protein VirB5